MRDRFLGRSVGFDTHEFRFRIIPYQLTQLDIYKSVVFGIMSLAIGLTLDEVTGKVGLGTWLRG